MPCFVWAPDARSLERHGIPERFTGRPYLGPAGMRRLFDDLERSLAAQRVVWLEGEHLPNRLELTDAAPAGVRLAG